MVNIPLIIPNINTNINLNISVYIYIRMVNCYLYPYFHILMLAHSAHGHRKVAQQAEKAYASQRPSQAQGPHDPDRAAPAITEDLDEQQWNSNCCSYMFICGCLMMFMYMLMLCDSIFINL